MDSAKRALQISDSITKLYMVKAAFVHETVASVGALGNAYIGLCISSSKDEINNFNSRMNDLNRQLKEMPWGMDCSFLKRSAEEAKQRMEANIAQYNRTKDTTVLAILDVVEFAANILMREKECEKSDLEIVNDYVANVVSIAEGSAGKRKAQSILKAINKHCDKIDKKIKDDFWKKNKADKEQLTLEKNSLIKKEKFLKQRLTELANQEESIKKRKKQNTDAEKQKKEFEKQIESLKARRDSLGIFKGREKKEIEREVESVSIQIQKLEPLIEEQCKQKEKECKEKLKPVRTTRKEVEVELQNIEKRILEINQLFDNPSEKRLEKCKQNSWTELDIEEIDDVTEEVTEEHQRSFFAKELKKGDCVKFGKYMQGAESTEKEEIEWKVIAVEEDEAWLISKYCLDVKPYNTEETSICWEKCSLRKWLNQEFFEMAFDDDEKEVIIEKKVINGENTLYENIYDGVDTSDKVYLLNQFEADEFFNKPKDRIAEPTAYAKMQGAVPLEGDIGTAWWLRSLGETPDAAGFVFGMGEIDEIGGNIVTARDCAVRPTIWVKTR